MKKKLIGILMTTALTASLLAGCSGGGTTSAPAASSASAEAASEAAPAETSEAEAEANKKIAESLTDNLIQFTQINTWNGQLPTYVSGGAAEALPVLSLNAVQQPEAGTTAE